MKNKEVNVAPLSGGFMITTIVGFILSAYYVFPKSAPWGFTFMVFFAVMFASSMVSMTYGPVASQLHVGGTRYKKIKTSKNKKKTAKKITSKPKPKKQKKKKKK